MVIELFLIRSFTCFKSLRNVYRCCGGGDKNSRKYKMWNKLRTVSAPKRGTKNVLKFLHVHDANGSTMVHAHCAWNFRIFEKPLSSWSKHGVSFCANCENRISLSSLGAKYLVCARIYSDFQCNSVSVSTKSHFSVQLDPTRYPCSLAQIG